MNMPLNAVTRDDLKAAVAAFARVTDWNPPIHPLAHQAQTTKNQAKQAHREHPKTTSDSRLNALLSRTAFGVSPTDVAVAEFLGFDEYLAYQMNPEAIDDSAIEGLLSDVFPELYAFSYQEMIAKVRADDDFRPGAQLVIAAMIRAIFSQAQLQEIMVEFWSNHFNVNITDGPIDFLKPIDDRDNIRPHALGKFSDLLHANAKSPAMLFYLDGYTNTVTGPNENYARELMELHTLGVDGGYTENDVKEVARCFTGWTLNLEAEGLFYFAEFNHDFGAKTVLETIIPAGGGVADGEAVLDLLAAHPATAQHIAQKLCQRFISDQPDAAVVNAVADTFLDTDGDIKAMLTVLFNSEAFADSGQQKFKRPMEYVASLFRTLQPTFFNNTIRLIFNQIEAMNQLPFYFPAPTGYPDVGGAWLNSNALLNRWNLGIALAFAGNGDNSQNNDNQDVARMPRVPLRDLIGDARTATEVTDAIIDQVLFASPTEADRIAMIAYTAQGREPDERLSFKTAVERGRYALAAVLISRYFQYR